MVAKRHLELTRMADMMSDYFQHRGSLCVLVILSDGPQRFTDLEDALQISTSTLTERLGEARDYGLITPEIDEGETSVDGQYRISERGEFVVRKMQQLDIVYAYRTMLEMHTQVENGRDELVDWMADKSVKKELARKSGKDPYVDPFGEGISGYRD